MKELADNALKTSSAIVYIHIPYCSHKCPYCDFNSHVVKNFPEQEYVSALCQELDARSADNAWKDRKISSIYFGGGTPSIFKFESIAVLLNRINLIFNLDTDVEITLEANPGSLSKEKLLGFKNAGINRLSLGSQSLDNKALEKLGRKHKAEQLRENFALAYDLGYQNLSLDLMYGYSGQTLDDLFLDLNQYKTLNPEHISAYTLTIEKGTDFYEKKAKGELILPEDDILADMYLLVRDELSLNLFQHYEISNFSKPGFESRHNLAYWNGQDYLGLGAGAHSYLQTKHQSGDIRARRWCNYSAPTQYIKVVRESGVAESWSENITESCAKFEFFFLGLRKISGVDLNDFRLKFGHDLDSRYLELIKDLVAEGLLSSINNNIRLSEKGLLLADGVIAKFAF